MTDQPPRPPKPPTPQAQITARLDDLAAASAAQGEKLGTILMQVGEMHAQLQAFQPMLDILRTGSDMQVAGAVRRWRAAARRIPQGDKT